MSIFATFVGNLDQATHVPIPEAYWDLQKAFLKTCATCLPPHHPWDCTINLLSGCTLPRWHIYPLLHADNEVMEAYVQEALAQGFIHLSTSPATSSFFFVKEGGHCPVSITGH